jgi:peptide methionine sulfoxide reductase msrA/msrB
MQTRLTLLFVLVLTSCSATLPADQPIVTSEYSQIVTVAGGCFWCMEAPFESLPGVSDVVSGYAGGTEVNPTYTDVSNGVTAHREAVQFTFDPTKITYQQLLDVFWRQINPTDAGGQFVDRGFQYSPAIFYHSVGQKQLAEQSLASLAQQGLFTDLIITPILEYTTFYPAEEYHQDYHTKNPLRYMLYRKGSGRDDFLDSVWGNDRL